MVKQPYTYTSLQPVFDWESDPDAEARSKSFIGEDSTVTANHRGGGVYDVYLHDEVTPGGNLLIDGTIPGRVTALEAQAIVAFTVTDNGDGTSTLTAVRNDASVTSIGTVDAAANDVASFTAVNDTITVTFTDGTAQTATTVDNFSTSGTLNASTLTVTRNDGGSFDMDLSALNETLMFDVDGVTLIFNDGEGSTTQFKDGRISADAANSIVRGTDGGLFAPSVSDLGSVFATRARNATTGTTIVPDSIATPIHWQTEVVDDNGIYDPLTGYITIESDTAEYKVIFSLGFLGAVTNPKLSFVALNSGDGYGGMAITFGHSATMFTGMTQLKGIAGGVLVPTLTHSTVAGAEFRDTVQDRDSNYIHIERIV